ncbi:MAG: UvrD-helicase domain-containing protein [Elusimicrobiota bacterium]|jgi:DNA helicase-2/ATP-dependent DNA helicase PcrA|nr:UvrD-helicase domain-containing protein [Elusimicrobiota bacterium]
MDLFENLNQSQKDAVLNINGPLIIFAGAGTGKTRVITHRIAYLISQGVSPWNILGVTFTNKAAAEMKKRVIELVPSQSSDNIWLSTFHSFCAYFLRIEAASIGLNSGFLIYDFSDQKNIVRDCIRELNLDEKRYKPSSIADIISRAKDDLQTYQMMFEESDKNGDFFRASISKIYKLYQEKLKTLDALDFGDLIMRTVSALQNFPAVLEKYQERFKYILVDEYQDTNRAQYILIKLLAAKYKNLCVVGDDDQSVYSWRGADINNILDFEKDYPSTKSVKLEQNYRSTPKILSSAWQVVKRNSDRVEKKLWTNNADDGDVSVLKTSNENDEALRVAQIISIKSQTDYNLSDFAVFYRTNAQSRVFEDAFRREGIAYAVIGTLKFYDRAEIKNIMAYLKLIYNPNDNISFKRIINIPKRSVGKTSIENLEKLSIKKGLSIWQSIPFIEEAGINRSAVNAIKNFVHLINGFISLKENSDIKTIALRVIASSGYLKELDEENTPESKIKIENIQELLTAIDDFQKRSPDDNTLGGYLTQIALISDIDSFDESKGKVTLMTLHLAKGLEFENVFICGLEEGLFPIGESSFNPQELQEERRLMYVGMTRAKKNLYLCWAVERMLYGKTRWNILSRFVIEAGFKDEFASDIPQRQSGFKFGKIPQKSWTVKQKQDNDIFPIDEPIEYEQPIIKDSSPFQIGVIVSHSVFGKGKIIDRNGSGNDLKLIVLFENGQWKKLLAKVAKLEVVQE